MTTQQIHHDRKLRSAINLIKNHITSAESAQNRDLHLALVHIVDVGRAVDLLDPAWTAELQALLTATAPAMYACEACAHDIEHSGISDDEGDLELTGRTGNFYALCCLCGAPATHEARHGHAHVQLP